MPSPTSFPPLIGQVHVCIVAIADRRSQFTELTREMDTRHHRAAGRPLCVFHPGSNAVSYLRSPLQPTTSLPGPRQRLREKTSSPIYDGPAQ
ncbi:hypothetical protein F2P81_004814 [Scophthalmus maximus]|uniref:Uncharacterized protein n=1 Tax=Scophthalmus maximus TaxID=52904 RepID=A0A6A4TAJ5_SCOMX|nr:hypothetical protein F2P81_004814 [Scophthalmus maximus]